MINIVAVHVGDYCGRGAEYLDRLFDGVGCRLTLPWRGWCVTDDASKLPAGVEAIASDPLVKGWWNKIALFRPDALPNGERVLYFDLDVVTVGLLDELAAYQGRFAILSDFYHPDRYGSSVMAWEAGKHDHVWRVWDRCGRPQFDPWGDQRWIETMIDGADRWQDILPGQIVSYKADRVHNGIPANARIVSFHGKPRPHEVGFIAEHIKAYDGGFVPSTIEETVNVS